MPWIKFSDNFDWNPEPHSGRVTIAYKRGMRLLVNTPCAEAAIATGKGKRCLPPSHAKHSSKAKAQGRS